MKKYNTAQFKDDEEEVAFFEEASSKEIDEFFEGARWRQVSFPGLKKRTKMVSVRLTEDMVQELKQDAVDVDVPYQAFMKILIEEGLQKRRAKQRS